MPSRESIIDQTYIYLGGEEQAQGSGASRTQRIIESSYEQVLYECFGRKRWVFAENRYRLAGVTRELSEANMDTLKNYQADLDNKEGAQYEPDPRENRIKYWAKFRDVVRRGKIPFEAGMGGFDYFYVMDSDEEKRILPYIMKLINPVYEAERVTWHKKREAVGDTQEEIMYWFGYIPDPQIVYSDVTAIEGDGELDRMPPTFADYVSVSLAMRAAQVVMPDRLQLLMVQQEQSFLKANHDETRLSGTLPVFINGNLIINR